MKISTQAVFAALLTIFSLSAMAPKDAPTGLRHVIKKQLKQLLNGIDENKIFASIKKIIPTNKTQILPILIELLYESKAKNEVLDLIITTFIKKIIPKSSRYKTYKQQSKICDKLVKNITNKELQAKVIARCCVLFNWH